MWHIAGSERAFGRFESRKPQNKMRGDIQQPGCGIKDVREDHQRYAQYGQKPVGMLDGDIFGCLFADDDLQGNGQREADAERRDMLCSSDRMNASCAATTDMVSASGKCNRVARALMAAYSAATKNAFSATSPSVAMIFRKMLAT